MTQIKFSTNPTLTSDFPKLPADSKSCLPDFKKREKKKSPRFTVYSKPENIFFLPFLNCHLLWDLDSSMSASLAWTTISLLHLAFTSIFSSSFLMVFHSMTLTWPTFLLFVSVYYFFSFFFFVTAASVSSLWEEILHQRDWNVVGLIKNSWNIWVLKVYFIAKASTKCCTCFL